MSLNFEEPLEPAWSVGGPVDEIHLTLRVTDDDLDPAAVTALLGTSPTTGFRKGDRGGVQKAGVWLYEVVATDLDSGIASLLSAFTEDPATWLRLKSLGRTDIYCGLHLHGWSRGTSLAPETMAALASRALTLEMDIYCSADDQEPDA